MSPAPIWRPAPDGYRAELTLDLPPEAAFMFRSSDNMVPLYSGSNVFTPAARDGLYLSQDVIVVGDAATSQYLLAGALTARRSLTRFFLIRDGRFRAIRVEQPDIRPGEPPEELVVLRGADWRKLLLEYADRAAAAMDVAPIRADANLTGYCTWYYYYDAVTEADFLENLDALAAARGTAYSPQVVQIDDGYQTFQGDWLDQDASWPTPLAEIGRRIAAAGMRPGIWLMPLLASTASRVFREHPDWFVRDENDRPLIIFGWSPPPDQHWACLDATLPEVRAHLTRVFQTFRAWGFTYFKLDGLCFGLPRGRRHDPEATPVSAFRLALQTIREAVPDATLLGCCPPFMACLGLLDHCRVSPDTSRYWRTPEAAVNCDGDPGATGIRNALHATESAFWFYDRWFRADPDALMARADNTFCTFGEARISAAAGILTGIAITSDHLGRIAPERRKLLACAARYRLRDALPLDWRPDRWPQCFGGTVDGRPAALLINDSDEPVEYSFDRLGLCGEAEEVLQGRGRCRSRLNLPPHDAALLIQTSGAATPAR